MILAVNHSSRFKIKIRSFTQKYRKIESKVKEVITNSNTINTYLSHLFNKFWIIFLIAVSMNFNDNPQIELVYRGSSEIFDGNSLLIEGEQVDTDCTGNYL